MELAYKRFGEGQPLIILHGLYGSSDNWLSFGKQLAGNDLEVYLVDLRNHGESPFDGSHTYNDMKKDIFTFCMHHEIKAPIILGHSMGGKAAMFFAAKYPDIVKKLIVIDISPRSYTKADAASQTVNHASIIAAMKNMDLDSIKTRTDAQKELMKAIPNERVVKFLLKNLTRNDGKKFAWKLNLDVLSKDLPEIMKGIEDKDITDVALLQELPALFIKGEKSNYIVKDDKTRIKEIFDKAEIVTIENAGHWVHAEQSDQVIQYILNFIAKA